MGHIPHLTVIRQLHLAASSMLRIAANLLVPHQQSHAMAQLGIQKIRFIADELEFPAQIPYRHTVEGTADFSIQATMMLLSLDVSIMHGLQHDAPDAALNLAAQQARDVLDRARGTIILARRFTEIVGEMEAAS